MIQNENKGIKRSKPDDSGSDTQQIPVKEVKKINTGQMTLAESFGQNLAEIKSAKSKSEEVFSTSKSFFLGDGKFPSPQVTLANWNVNGVRAVQKRGDLQSYIKQFSPDVLVLNETKIDKIAFEKDKPNLDIPKEYFQFWNFCKTKKGYSGVSLFSKVKPISIKEDIGIEKHDLEGRTITAEFDKFYVVGSYVPNSGEGLRRLDYRTKEYNVDMHKYQNDLREKKHVVWAGDLNVAHKEIDIHQPKGNERNAGFTPQERAGMTKLLDDDWVDTFRWKHPQMKKYSWWSLRGGARSGNKGWRLDYMICDQGFTACVKNSRIEDYVKGSDHCPVELDLDLDMLDKKPDLDMLDEKPDLDMLDKKRSLRLKLGIYIP